MVSATNCSVVPGLFGSNCGGPSSLGPGGVQCNRSVCVWRVTICSGCGVQDLRNHLCKLFRSDASYQCGVNCTFLTYPNLFRIFHDGDDSDPGTRGFQCLNLGQVFGVKAIGDQHDKGWTTLVDGFQCGIEVSRDCHHLDPAYR